ncbi:MAG: hypothetical protein GY869_26875, partial [Planctomycetes bacterium]|nr:hypothetical protein [Planctomycetota bacterium]
MARTKRRVGRPRDGKLRYYGPDGAEIPEIHIDKDGNHSVRWKDKDSGKWKKRNLGRKEKYVYKKYLSWKAEHDGVKTVTIDALKGSVPTGYSFSKVEFTHIDDDGKFGETEIKELKFGIPDLEILERAKDIIDEFPRKAAEVLGIPYENLIGLKKRKIYTLHEIGDHYFNQSKYQNLKLLKRSQINEYKEMKKSWDKFVKILGVETVVEVKK